MESKDNSARKKKRKRRLLLILILFIILLILLICVYIGFLRSLKNHDLGIDPKAGSLVEPEEIEVVKPIKKEPIKPVVTIKKPPKIKEVPPVVIDTTPPVVIEPEPPDPCLQDTIAPWVFPDPSGGLHYGTTVVRLIANERCQIEWKFKQDTQWLAYDQMKDSIILEQDVELCYRAQDSCGNEMKTRYEKYEITLPLSQRLCPKNMEYIKIENHQFCIDQYEWPNKKNIKPKSNISLYHAIDSCFKAGKRLCSTEEWMIACAGAYSWKYPYGKVYEPEACVTKHKSVQRTGSKPECRGYFEIFDMAGNLAEWTNTRAKSNNAFYNVMGGFWESGPQSTCSEPRYSYYPRNTHNPVGFRCCKEVNKKNN